MNNKFKYYHSLDKKTQSKTGRVFHFDFRVKIAVAAAFISLIGFTFLFRYLAKEPRTEMMAYNKEKARKVVMPQGSETETAKEKMADSAAFAEQPITPDAPGTIKKLPSNQVMEYEKQEEGEKFIPLCNGGSAIAGNTVINAEQKNFFTYKWNDQNDGDQSKIDSGNFRKEGSKKDENISLFAGFKSEQDKKTMTDSVSPTSGYASDVSTALLNKVAPERTITTLAESQTKSKASIKVEDKESKNAKFGLLNTTTTTDNTKSESDQRYTNAILKYDSLDYTGSKNLLESYLTNFPDDYNAQYYCGASNYFLKQYDKAITYFEKVVKKNDNSFYDISQWYLALSYIGNNDKPNAEKILNQIVAANGSFKNQAVAKLIEIKK